MAGVDKFDGEELADIFGEIFSMFSSDEPNAKIVTTTDPVRNMYDESDSRSESFEDIFIVNIGNPLKQKTDTAGDQGSTKTTFLTDTVAAHKVTTGTEIEYRNQRYVVRQWETKEIRGVDLIGYGVMELVPKQA